MLVEMTIKKVRLGIHELQQEESFRFQPRRFQYGYKCLAEGILSFLVVIAGLGKTNLYHLWGGLSVHAHGVRLPDVNYQGGIALVLYLASLVGVSEDAAVASETAERTTPSDKIATAKRMIHILANFCPKSFLRKWSHQSEQ